MREKIKGVAVALVLWTGLITLGNSAKADEAPWHSTNEYVTMDVIKTYGGGGTLRCPSARDCYVRVLQNQQRGITEYCESVTIKQNGRVIWHRDYSDPYWVALQRLKGTKGF